MHTTYSTAHESLPCTTIYSISSRLLLNGHRNRENNHTCITIELPGKETYASSIGRGASKCSTGMSTFIFHRIASPKSASATGSPPPLQRMGACRASPDLLFSSQAPAPPLRCQQEERQMLPEAIRLPHEVGFVSQILDDLLHPTGLMLACARFALPVETPQAQGNFRNGLR